MATASPPSIQLPTEAITNILSRIPTKPLLRFKLVSKSWYSLISSPTFAKLHLSNSLTSSTNRHLLISYTSLSSAPFNHRRLTFTQLNHPLNHLHVEFIGSSNGILCISDNHIPRKVMCLYNPSTKSHRVIPQNNILPLPKAMPLNPNLLPTHLLNFGFGYDSLADDFKILGLYHQCDGPDGFCSASPAKGSLYSMKGDSWKAVKVPFSNHLQDNDGVLVNEVLHFVVYDDPEKNYLQYTSLCFDLRSEKFSILELPSNLGPVCSMIMSELGGCLSVVVNWQAVDWGVEVNSCEDMMNSRKLARADLWVMREYGKKESWVKVFSIRDPMEMGVPCSLQIHAVVYSDDKEKVLLELDCVSLGWYHLGSGKFEKVNAAGLPRGNEPFGVSSFVGSVVSVSKAKVLKSGGASKKKTKNTNNKKKNRKKNKGKHGFDVDNLSETFKLQL